MSTTLISFLGNRKENGEYKRVQYHYKGEANEPVTYIGYALQKILQPDRFVIFGTTGSMWDHLFESDLKLDTQLEEERLALMESVEDKRHVTQEQLDLLAPLLSKILATEVILKIIPPAHTEQEQLELLELIDAVLDEEGSLYLDVTHGYRSMPLVSFAAVQFLNTVKPKIRVKNIFYGELAEQEGYIRELSGLLNLNQWNKAFYHSECTGDYSLIAELLPEDSEVGQLISQASFYESIHLFGKARGAFNKARKILEDQEFMGPASLFKPALLERTAWVGEQYAYLRQRSQAFRSLENNDYLRAVLYGYEAYLTARMSEHSEYKNDIGDGRRRSAFAELLRQSKNFKSKEKREQYHFLRQLRNALAHGEEAPTKEIQSAVHDSKELHTHLQHALKILLD